MGSLTIIPSTVVLGVPKRPWWKKKKLTFLPLVWGGVVMSRSLTH